MSVIDEVFIKKVMRICPNRVSLDFDLGSHSWWQIGGRVRLLARPATIDEICALRITAKDAGIRILVVGEMSNLLITDDEIDALCIRLGNDFSRLELIGEQTVEVESGIWVPALARSLQRYGFTGLEHICGIPGTLGGLVMMNGGSLRKSISSHIVSVRSVDCRGQTFERSADECEFAYRKSVFETLDEIITLVTLRLAPGERGVIRREMLSILQSRRLKFPRKFPNCGSVFKSNPATYLEHGPPGAMIERAGWKGVEFAGAQVSPLHANFIINQGGAQAKDVLKLIGEIQKSVEAQSGQRMEPEVRYVNQDGSVLAADEAYGRSMRDQEI